MRLSASNLSCARGDMTVLSDLSFTLAPGDCLIVRGPNGSGKSTLLRTLAGIATPSAGEIRVDPDQIAYSGHLDAIKAQLTVAENLAFWAGIYGTSLAGDAMLRFNLIDLQERQAHQLSAGQKRRLGLARLFLSNRRIWILDEPTVSLDAENTGIFVAAIISHCSSGGIVVASTHIDLDIEAATSLDLSQYKPRETSQDSPFLQGDFT
jgi:heme exporter protein A